MAYNNILIDSNTVIGVMGTGNVGLTIAKKLLELGYNVNIGSRTATNPKTADLMTAYPDKLTTNTFHNTANKSDMIFNCVSGMGTLEAIKMAGIENLVDKLIIDLANPLDFSNGFPPTLGIANTSSLGEQVQELLPNSFVVKTLNTMSCDIMVKPELVNGGDHNVFVSGNDDNAKTQVKTILNSFGWNNESILDLGDITTSRGTEMYLPLWVRIFGARQNGMFNIKIVD